MITQKEFFTICDHAQGDLSVVSGRMNYQWSRTGRVELVSTKGFRPGPFSPMTAWGMRDPSGTRVALAYPRNAGMLKVIDKFRGWLQKWQEQKNANEQSSAGSASSR